MSNPPFFHLDGKVEAVGASTFARNSSIYSTLIFNDASGRKHLFNEIFAMRNANTQLHPGVEGRFFFANTVRGLCIYAVATRAITVDDLDFAKVERGLNRKVPVGFLVIGIVGLVIAMLLTFAAGGGAPFFWTASVLTGGLPFSAFGLVMLLRSRPGMPIAAMRDYMNSNLPAHA